MAKRMTKQMGFLMMLVALVFIAACQDNKTVPDNMIMDKVKAALASYENLSATVKDGVVTLNGTVASEELGKTAADVVSKIPGVKSVDNKLQVVAPEPQPSAEEAPPLPEVEETPPPAPEGQTAGEYLDDSVITTRVKGALAANVALSSLDIKVDTMNKVVTLTGSVKNQETIDLAIKVASEVDGVKEVVNGLTIAQ